MALLYDWYETPDSFDKPEDEKVLYPRVCFRFKMTTEKLCKRIEQMSTASRSDILLVLSALSDIMGYELREGSLVQLDGIGSFSVSLSATEPVYRSTENKAYKVAIGDIRFKPAKELKEAVKMARAQRMEDKMHSAKLTDEATDSLLTTYFAERHFITRSGFQSLCHLAKCKACIVLRQLVDDGKLLNEGTKRQPIYVPAPGFYGKAAIEETEPTEEQGEPETEQSE